MNASPYEVLWSNAARRAVTQKLPEGVAVAAADLITGPLRDHPRRIGKPLGEELAGIYSARLARDWCVLYEIDEISRAIMVLDIRHRSVAYRVR
ncbi:mRNA interferase RelE/StbE [Haloechinothrix alba]|uniref:mRNA interferase RelE/StbE n=1 Tax=Haloechinothrix alba TaxID=664784 RepID=A0A238V013_9PSEU|nr:type II toxin-antitoxin system RelE/ParE family toxin [Haloechinothrix alba]SNR27521.1 mRNA interferase RelE/StbE [Haloechinothrix alba]